MQLYREFINTGIVPSDMWRTVDLPLYFTVSTKRDPHAVRTYQAFALGLVLRRARERRVRMVRAAYRLYGDHGSLISGCERDHFPTPVKDRLRRNARFIVALCDAIDATWAAAGRRSDTWWRRFAGRYRVDGCRY